eukprot:TRINITY_DN6841_c0_g1_i5.p1 TRINITY_DN6841_c0_g1~~TRINITY_DN6841_c0_g1_i5.p1  ORF type:complete len:291 (+),score=78.79 TRINITY_DN6841_c0_g1_i5:90-875(+)
MCIRDRYQRRVHGEQYETISQANSLSPRTFFMEDKPNPPAEQSSTGLIKATISNEIDEEEDKYDPDDVNAIQKLVKPSNNQSHDHGNIKFTVMGTGECPIDENATEIELYGMRIGKIQGLEKCNQLRRLGLRQNLIPDIEGVENLLLIEELELYDNRITRIENIAHMTNMRVLDLSFNNIKKIEGLETLGEIESLFLLANKIKKIENITNKPKMTMLELGANKIEVIENLEECFAVKSLYLAKNKIKDCLLYTSPSPRDQA